MTSAFVVGEALVDVVRRAGAQVAHPGGSPLNVAVGLARLGLRTTLHTSLADDDNGRLVAAHLAASGVATTAESFAAASTAIAEATIAPDGSASYRFRIDWTVPVADPGPVDVVHTGSIAAALPPGADAVAAMLETARPVSTVSYDPNVRPQLMGSPEAARPRVERMVALADVVKASDEDLAWLYPGEAPAVVLRRWLDAGALLVVVTRGDEGADGLAASGQVHIDAPTTDAADTIGAGDSFMAGLLAALADHDLLGAHRRPALAAVDAATVREVVAFAARCAAITVSRPGADPPTRAELAG